MYYAQNRHKKTRLPTVGLANEAGHLVFVSFSVVVEELQKIFTKCGYFIFCEAVLEDFLEVLWLRRRRTVIATECSGRYKSFVVILDSLIDETPFSN